MTHALTAASQRNHGNQRGNEPSAQEQTKPNVLNNNNFPRSLRP